MQVQDLLFWRVICRNRRPMLVVGVVGQARPFYGFRSPGREGTKERDRDRAVRNIQSKQARIKCWRWSQHKFQCAWRMNKKERERKSCRKRGRKSSVKCLMWWGKRPNLVIKVPCIQCIPSHSSKLPDGQSAATIREEPSESIGVDYACSVYMYFMYGM